MKTGVPTLLSFNGGYADTAGYLALQGLFTSHVTGNFVTLGAALALGTSGIVAKLLALPVFCIVIVLTRLASFTIVPRSWPAFETLLSVQVALLLVGAALAIGLGPFLNGDSWPAIVTGMTLVSAMAIQNAVQRIHMGSSPPTTIMTGTTTQIMIDVADTMRGLSPEARDAARARLRRMSIAVASFAGGAAIAALLFSKIANWCFAVPPVVALLARISAGSATPAAVAASGG
ncbi:MAG TPA: DUF1275 family protein [Steroidobacteraceae bacterium]|nr:DUF1275 family protein [Steroidobacteraceae bacterium]